MNIEAAFILPVLKQIQNWKSPEGNKQINTTWCPNCLISVQPDCQKQIAFLDTGKKRQLVTVQAGTSSFSSSNWRLQKMHCATAGILLSSTWVPFKRHHQSQGQGTLLGIRQGTVPHTAMGATAMQEAPVPEVGWYLYSPSDPTACTPGPSQLPAFLTNKSVNAKNSVRWTWNVHLSLNFSRPLHPPVCSQPPSAFCWTSAMSKNKPLKNNASKISVVETHHPFRTQLQRDPPDRYSSTTRQLELWTNACPTSLYNCTRTAGDAVSIKNPLSAAPCGITGGSDLELWYHCYQCYSYTALHIYTKKREIGKNGFKNFQTSTYVAPKVMPPI